MEAIILGNPYDIVLGAITPIDIPAYEAEQAVIQLTNGYNPYLIGGTVTTSGDSYWFRYSSGLLRPLTSTDNVVIGGTSLLGTEKVRVVGKLNTTSLQLGSTVTISSILDEDTMVSDSDTAVPTQQSVKAYVDTQVGGYLQSGDNISLLTNDLGYIITETDPIFTSSASYSIVTGDITNWNNAYSWGDHALVGYITTELDPVFTASPSYGITSTQITYWDSAYGWGNHALAGYITTETDPIFVASASYSIVTLDITHWNLAYTNNHTHTNKVLLDSLINSGAGTLALFDDGTYKTVLTTTAGSTTQLIYNNAGVYAGSANMVYDGTTTTINTLLTPLLEIGNSSTTIIKDSSGNLTFYDAVVAASYTLADLIGTATNYWTPSGSNIWYGYKVGVGGTGTFTEALEVTGNILADNFNSSYFKYDSNGNLLLGPNAGALETGVSKLYIHNNSSTTPLIYGNFTTLDTTLGGHLIIRDDKKLKFGSLGTVNIYHALDSSNYSLYFQDGFNTAALSLSDLRDGDYYSLVSAYTEYSAVTSITAANKTVWNKASYITITGDGTKYLSDNGVYNTITGSITVTDNILKWDTTTFRPYTTKSEAGGSSSNGKFYRDATDYPSATTQLVYDGDYYSTNLYSTSLEIGNYLLYRSGSPTGTILTLRDFTDDWTILRMANDNESTLALIVVDSGGEDLHVMDIYNQVYSSPKMGIRMYAHDTSTTFRPFYIEYSNGGVEYQAITILPRTTLTSNDTEVKIGNVLSIIDSTTYITRDSSYNLTFTDAITGTKTLAQLASGTTYIFSNGLTNTSGTVILGGTISSETQIYVSNSLFEIQGDTGYEGAYFSIQNDSGNIAELGYSNTNISYIQANSTGLLLTYNSTSATFGTTGFLYSADYSSTYTDRSLVDKAYVDSVIVTPISNILEWDSVSNYYRPYTASTVGCFDSSTTDPTDVTRLNYNGHLYATSLHGVNSTEVGVYGVSTSGYAVYGNCSSGSAIRGNTIDGISGYFLQSGLPTGNISSSILSVIRQHTTGTSYNITGNIINIIDNPVTSGTISGSLLKGTIGSTIRVDMNPRVIDTTGNYAYIFDTNASLSSAGLVKILNNGNNRVLISRTGRITAYDGFNSYTDASNFTNLSGNALQITLSSTVRTTVNPGVGDSSIATAYMLDTSNTLSTTGAKIVSIKNSGTEKVIVDKDGVIEITAVGQGIILASPDGTRYKITVANGGTLAVTAV